MKTHPEVIANEAKALVALAFRNGPIEDIHSGIECPNCSDEPQYSGVNQAEMKDIMKIAVNRVYTLFLLRENDPKQFKAFLKFGSRYTSDWDDPDILDLNQF